MEEPKLKQIKKEKLDNFFTDEKEPTKKGKKKTKGKNKKRNEIDLFDEKSRHHYISPLL